MHKYLLILVFVATSLFADIKWAEDYKSALKEAEKVNKKVMLVFTDENCEECEAMRKAVFTDAEVSKLANSRFVSVEIDVEYDGRKGYKVFKTPTFYFLDPKGKQIGDAVVGAYDAAAFLAKLQEIEQSK